MNMNGKQLNEVMTADGPAIDGAQLLEALTDDMAVQRMTVEEHKRRLTECHSVIQAALAKYKCRLVIQPQIDLVIDES